METHLHFLLIWFVICLNIVIWIYMETSLLLYANVSYILGSVLMYVFESCLYFQWACTLLSEGDLCILRSLVSMVQTLQSLRDEKLLRAMTDLAPSGLPAQQEVLRTLALLLTGADSTVSEAVMRYLAAASRNEHFREKVGHSIMDIKPEACLIFYHLLLIFGQFFYKNNFLLLIDNIYSGQQFTVKIYYNS